MADVVPFPNKPIEPTVPDFISRADINQMSDVQLDDMLNGIRERRLLNYLVYRTTEEQKDQARSEKAQVAIEKKCGQIIKQLIALDNSFEKLEKYINELRGLRIQAGLSVI